jgi:hypothetical protein
LLKIPYGLQVAVFLTPAIQPNCIKYQQKYSKKPTKGNPRFPIFLLNLIDIENLYLAISSALFLNAVGRKKSGKRKPDDMLDKYRLFLFIYVWEFSGDW